MTIPAEWTQPLRVALQATFGLDAPDEVLPLSGGLSGAPVLRIAVQGRRYLLRLDPPVEGFGDPRHWHGCMRIAAAAEVAPRVLFADPGGVSIVDYVEPAPNAPDWTRDRAGLVADLGGLLRRLHAAPAFPALFDYLDGMDALIANVTAAGLLSGGEMAAPLARFSELSKAYRALSPQPVPSHNDVNPRNLVHDGARFWLVDWLSAFQSDRYVDLASVASFFARDPASEARLLHAYFAAPATEAQVARLHLARLVSHMFYAMTLMTTTSGARPPRRRGLDALHAALAAGEPVLDSPQGRAEYALARMAAMAQGVEDAAFADARRLAA